MPGSSQWTSDQTHEKMLTNLISKQPKNNYKNQYMSDSETKTNTTRIKFEKYKNDFEQEGREFVDWGVIQLSPQADTLKESALFNEMNFTYFQEFAEYFLVSPSGGQAFILKDDTKANHYCLHVRVLLKEDDQKICQFLKINFMEDPQ